jgi:hypothetical protein
MSVSLHGHVGAGPHGRRCWETLEASLVPWGHAGGVWAEVGVGLGLGDSGGAGGQRGVVYCT